MLFQNKENKILFGPPPPKKKEKKKGLKDTNGRYMYTRTSVCLYNQPVTWIFTRSRLSSLSDSDYKVIPTLKNLSNYSRIFHAHISAFLIVFIHWKTHEVSTKGPLTLTEDVNNVRLRNVRKFTYLGVRLTSNGIFLQTQKALSEQARKAMFSLFSLFDMISLNVSEKLKMFDAMISPILNYGSEIWGFHKSVDIERLHLKKIWIQRLSEG